MRTRLSVSSKEMDMYPAPVAATETGEGDLKRHKHGEWQKWLRFDRLDDDVDMANLEKECRNLVETWKNSGAVDEWEKAKEKRVGKAQTFLTKYCDTLLAHSQLFSIIPQGDKYTSVFTGVVSSLVKAVCRHREIAEGFSQALAEISDKMSFSCKQSFLYSNDKIRELVIRLYIRYFKFLCLTMEWFSKKKRIRSSFDQSYIPKKIQTEVKDIKGIAEGIQTEVALEFQRDVKERLEEMASSLGKATTARPVISEQYLLPPSEVELVPGNRAIKSLPASKDGASMEDRPEERLVTSEQYLLPPSEEVELAPCQRSSRDLGSP
ncbi:hypothetical protein PG996_013727 [Apiospora saccharicola]|uniref:DUF7708 domain-containing protein n=1 Tax=Apiospora saccharicola TaxID=335842 RepID=A0ABR1U8D6_9PEZI